MKILPRKNSLSFFKALCIFAAFFACFMPHLAQAEVDTIKVTNYEMDLENIETDPTATAKNIVKAKDLYFGTFTEQDSPETRDAAFLVFYKYFLKIAEKTYNDAAFNNLSVIDENAVSKAREVAATYGLHLVAMEGSYVPVADTNYLVKTFGKYVSPTLRAYFAFAKKNEYVVEDAGLTVSYDELREMIILGDSIAKKFPDTAIAALVQNPLNRLVDLYLLGIDNTPVYGAKRVLLPEVKSSYNRFLKENKTSTYYPIVKFAYDLLQKNNFKVTDNVSKTIVKKLREMGIVYKYN